MLALCHKMCFPVKPIAKLTIPVMHMIRKGQICGVEKGDILGQATFISGLFGIAA